MHKRFFIRVVITLLLVVQLLPFQTNISTVQAATFNIANNDVAGLKNALTAANPPHVINLAANGVYTLTTIDNTNSFGPNGLPEINRNITINGNGATIVRNPDAPEFRIFFIATNGSLTLNNLTVKNGKIVSNDPSYGGGGAYNSGILNINNSSFTENQTTANGGAITNLLEAGASGTFLTATLNVNNSHFSANTTEGFGGGAIYNATGVKISSSGPLGSVAVIARITNSTFSVNQTNRGVGGAIFNGAASSTASRGGSFRAETIVVNSTLWLNQAANGGGAIANFGFGENGTNTVTTLDVINSTIADNVANNAAAGGVLQSMFFGGGTTTARLRNNIFSDNLGKINDQTAGSNCFSSPPLTFANGLNNLEYQAGEPNATPTCGAGSAMAGSTVLDFMPANNGGPTPTITLTLGSPARNAGDNATCADPATVNNKDQRGVKRPQGSICDIGAVEVEEQVPPTSLVVTNTQDAVNNPPQGSLRQRLEEAKTVANPVITFDAALGNSPEITLAGNLSVTGLVTIQGNCANPVKIKTQPGSAATLVSIKQSVKISGLVFSSLQLLAEKGSNSFSCSKVYQN